jgi:hypothetical protein
MVLVLLTLALFSTSHFRRIFAYNEMRDLALGLVAPIPRSALAHEANKAQA